MLDQHGLCLVENDFALDGEFSVVKPGANPSAYVISAVIGNCGAQKCQRQHLWQGRKTLRVEHGTNTKQYGAGDKKTDSRAGFQKRDCRHNEQRVLLVLFCPLQEDIADDMCLAGTTRCILALVEREL